MVLPASLSRAVSRGNARGNKPIPTEEVAYDLLNLANTHPGVGSGLIGELPEAVEEIVFLDRIRQLFRVPVIRHTRLT